MAERPRPVLFLDPAKPEGEALLEAILQTWVVPAARVRGIQAEITRAMIELPINGQPIVRINDETPDFIARVVAAGPIAEGQEVTTADISEILSAMPAETPPNHGWIAFTRVASEYHIAYDFRRNRPHAIALVSRGHQFLSVARLSLERELLGPAIENAFAAAELAVSATMFLFDEPVRRHDERRDWFREWAELGNVPEDHAHALAALYSFRASARYGEGGLPDRAEIEAVLEAVADSLQIVEERATAAVDDNADTRALNSGPPESQTD